jgi:hypothetical protein
MMADDLREDRVAQALAGLVRHGSDRTRATRVRDACHRQLRRQGSPTRRRVRTTRSSVRSMLEPVLVTAVSAVFLLEVLWRALRLARF